MLSNLRILSVVIAISAIFPVMAIAENIEDFSQCPANWGPYVEMVEEFKSSFPQIVTHEFLFMGIGTGIRNCLNEDFSGNYLASLQKYLIFNSQIVEKNGGLKPTEKCSVGQITSGPRNFSIVWLPYDEERLEGDSCKGFISKTLTDFISANKF